MRTDKCHHRDKWIAARKKGNTAIINYDELWLKLQLEDYNCNGKFTLIINILDITINL